MTARRRVLFPMGAAAAAAVVGVGASALLAWNAAHQPPVRFALSGTGTMAGASGDVTTLPSGGGALISLTGLPELAPGQVYELWLFDGSGRAVPAGVFKPGAGGSATVAVRRPLAAVRQVAVTAEAGPRGTQVPTVKPELGGSAP